jgi:hypothetical protein
LTFIKDISLNCRDNLRFRHAELKSVVKHGRPVSNESI